MTSAAARTRWLLLFAAAAAFVGCLVEGCGQAPHADLERTGDGSAGDSAVAASSGGSASDAPADTGACEGSSSEASSGGLSCSSAPADAGVENGALDGGEVDAAPSGDANEAAGDTSVIADAFPGSEAAGPNPIVFLDASCPVEIEAPPLLPGIHVDVDASILWDSNPPSSGPHYPIWAAYQAYTTPVPRGYYVHDLEHGAIVFLYNCGDAGCPDVVLALQAASDAIPDDPLCTSLGEGVRVRTVITPDPLLDVPVAAAAWGWVYKAQCVDPGTLRDFALQHYGQGPEMFCSNGTTQF
jgi:hypothetical protein